MLFKSRFIEHVSVRARLYIFMFGIAVAPFVHSDVIVASGLGSGQILAGDSSDIMMIAATNSAGVSFNEMASLVISGKDLKLSNSASLNEKLTSNGEAELIILDASSSGTDVVISGGVEVVGKPADLVINAGVGGRIVCDNCSFKGVARLILATADVQNGALGAVESIVSGAGEISIEGNGLDGAGLVFLDLLSENIAVRGNVTTNYKGDVAADHSGYVLSEDGASQLVSGSVRAFLGSNVYSYKAAKVIGVVASDQVFSNFTGDEGTLISTGSFSIESTSRKGRVELNSAVSTLGDALMTGIYKGKNIIPDETISIKTIGELNYVRLNADLSTQGEIALESAASITVGAYTADSVPELTSGVINIAVVNGLENYGVLLADRIMISSNEIVNEGSIVGQTTYIHGEKSITNQFGGIIYSNILSIKSDGLVTNGSMRPYRLFYRYVARTLSYGTVYEGGTYTDLEEDPIGSERLETESLVGAILGDKVEIHAGELVNINPYYILHDNEFGISLAPYLDPEKSEQVMISAENSLVLVAKTRILNSSSVIQVNEGGMVLSAPSITNQRYRVQVDSTPGAELPPNFCVEYDGCRLAPNQYVTFETASQYIHYFSPPGRIYSGSDSIFIAEDNLQNEMSFIEVFGDLDVSIKNISQVGFRLQQLYSVSVVTQHRKKYCSRKVFGQCVNHKTRYWKTSSKSLHQVDVGQLPALFSVAGFLSGKGAGSISLTTLSVDE